MNAGASATAMTAGGDRHPANPHLPYQSRTLSRSERTRRETFVLYSPRNRRLVTLCELLPFSLAIQFEFTPSLDVYVERPRRMAVGPKQEIDLSFWTRTRSGEERFYLAIPSSGTVGSTAGVASIRDRDLLDKAAERHGLQLTYVLERDLIADSAKLGAYFLLLPHVQSTRRILCRTFIREGIRALFTNMPRASFRQLAQALDRFDPEHVVSVAASMIHDGSLRLTDFSTLTRDSILEAAHVA